MFKIFANCTTVQQTFTVDATFYVAPCYIDRTNYKNTEILFNFLPFFSVLISSKITETRSSRVKPWLWQFFAFTPILLALKEFNEFASTTFFGKRFQSFTTLFVIKLNRDGQY
ncbi:hypothetical protein BpHYR1_038825 [Brachionus plicatilis]|uniref:Uncharacterized protein n=1 Tax=Brachionus plicatilis TaxID=10195 RepID=A0A3M7SAV8_BRAPC|nr:hypothetical protein BpHYR1_038825 [Brachionus plicatilis]